MEKSITTSGVSTSQPGRDASGSKKSPRPRAFNPHGSRLQTSRNLADFILSRCRDNETPPSKQARWNPEELLLLEVSAGARFWIGVIG
jgi:hypothetical protein